MNRQSHASPDRRSIFGAIKASALTSIAIAAIGAWSPLAAHHSFSAEFDATKQLRVTGTVTKLDWQNPHAWIHMTATELCERTVPEGQANQDSGPEWACRTAGGNEAEADWAFELASPNGLMRQGWSRTSLKPGDVITVLGSRARDGSTNSNARNITTSDGKRLFAGSSQDSNP